MGIDFQLFYLWLVEKKLAFSPLPVWMEQMFFLGKTANATIGVWMSDVAEFSELVSCSPIDPLKYVYLITNVYSFRNGGKY